MLSQKVTTHHVKRPTYSRATALDPCAVVCRPPNYVVALTGASQAGTQFPLAAKMGCCQSGASQAGTQFPLAAKMGCCQSGASQAAVGPRAH